MDWLTVTEYVSQMTTYMLIPFVIIASYLFLVHTISPGLKQSNTADATYGAGTAYPSETPVNTRFVVGFVLLDL